MRDRWGLDSAQVVMVIACGSAFYGFAMVLNAATGGLRTDASWGALWVAFGVFLALLAIFLRLGKTDRD